jgi:hypothetical protein
MRTFVPFHELRDRSAIIVDGAHSDGLILSHWKGQNTLTAADDTSAGVVLNALRHREDFPALDLPHVTATHFDIDGFIGVWSLFEPELALEHEAVLKAVARIGDFREPDLSRPEDDTALKLVCWIDTEERERFYPPYGEEQELKACAEKFSWFLPRFAEVLQKPEQFREIWEADYDRVRHDYAVIHSDRTTVSVHDTSGLVVIRTPEPVSYYALFSATHGSDIVASVYDNNRYELEYKYTTWVDIVSRPTLPRLSLQPLCDQLNAMESSGQQWFCDGVTDTGPLLRIENSELSKEQRFAHPTERRIFSSSIEPEIFIAAVTNFFAKNYQGIPKKSGWSWKEIRAVSI